MSREILRSSAGHKRGAVPRLRLRGCKRGRGPRLFHAMNVTCAISVGGEAAVPRGLERFADGRGRSGRGVAGTGTAPATLRHTGPRRSSDLAAIEGVTQPSVTALVTSLERAGLVERRSGAATRSTGGSSWSRSPPPAWTASRSAAGPASEVFARLVGRLPADEAAALAAAVPALERQRALDDAGREPAPAAAGPARARSGLIPARPVTAAPMRAVNGRTADAGQAQRAYGGRATGSAAVRRARGPSSSPPTVSARSGVGGTARAGRAPWRPSSTERCPTRVRGRARPS
jgi:hypothetical protein